MDYKMLAEMLYPNVKDTSFWEEKYKNRNLDSGCEVTRIAPSPTGFMHIGNFFGAMIDFEIAKTTNGVFYFRLEDTDRKRLINGADFVALQTLDAFGINPNEGLTLCGNEVGAYGPYRQSERTEIYMSYAKKLVEEAKAFPCFCKKTGGIEEVKAKRENQIKESQSINERDICRNLTLSEIEEKLKQGKNFALRLKSTGTEGKKVKAFDLCRGEIELSENCKDVVLIKDNKIPPYAFAHAVDDHLMKTTTVVRGSEWISTWPQHLEIIEKLNFKPCKYLHTPLISKIGNNGNKRKISKRFDPEADMRYYIEKGIPTTAVCEYVLNLANSSFEPWREANPMEDFRNFPFNPKKIGLSSPLFDMNKLLDISKNIIKKMNAEEVYNNVLNWALVFDTSFAKKLKENKEYSIEVFNIDRETKKPRKDLAMYSQAKEIFSFAFTDFVSEMKLENYEVEKHNFANVKLVLEEYLKVFNYADSKDVWFSKIKEMAQNLGFATDNKEFKESPEKFKGNVATVCEFIRVGLTGRKNSPDLFTIISILGEDETKNRLKKLSGLL